MWSQNIHLISDRRKLHRATPDSYILKKDERRSRRKMTSRRFLAVVFHATHFGDLQLGRCERAVASLLGKTRLDFSPGATWFLKLDVKDFNGWCFFWWLEERTSLELADSWNCSLKVCDHVFFWYFVLLGSIPKQTLVQKDWRILKPHQNLTQQWFLGQVCYDWISILDG